MEGDGKRSEADSVVASCKEKEKEIRNNRRSSKKDRKEMKQTCSVNELKGIAEMSAVVCDKDFSLDLCTLWQDRVEILLRVRREFKEEDRL